MPRGAESRAEPKSERESERYVHLSSGRCRKDPLARSDMRGALYARVQVSLKAGGDEAREGRKRETEGERERERYGRSLLQQTRPWGYAPSGLVKEKMGFMDRECRPRSKGSVSLSWSERWIASGLRREVHRSPPKPAAGCSFVLSVSLSTRLTRPMSARRRRGQCSLDLFCWK